MAFSRFVPSILWLVFPIFPVLEKVTILVFLRFIAKFHCLQYWDRLSMIFLSLMILSDEGDFNLKRFYPKNHPRVFLYTVILVFVYTYSLYFTLKPIFEYSYILWFVFSHTKPTFTARIHHSLKKTDNSQQTDRQTVIKYKDVLKKVVRKENIQEKKFVCMKNEHE